MTFLQALAKKVSLGIAFVEYTKSSNTGGNTTANRTQAVPLPPSRQPGDLMVIVTGCYNGNATIPSGWTEISRITNSTRTRSTIFARFCDGTEGSTVNVTVNNSDSTLNICMLFTGVNPIVPIESAATQSSASATSTGTLNTPSVTTTADTRIGEALIVRGAVSYAGTGSSFYGFPAGWQELVDEQAVTAGDSTLVIMGIAAKAPTVIGAQGTLAITQSISEGWTSFTFALNPA